MHADFENMIESDSSITSDFESDNHCLACIGFQELSQILHFFFFQTQDIFEDFHSFYSGMQRVKLMQ